MKLGAASAILGLIISSVAFATGAASQAVPGRAVGGGGAGSAGAIGGSLGTGAASPGGLGGSSLRIDGSLNSTLGGAVSAPPPAELPKLVAPAAAADPGSPPAQEQSAPDGGGSNCICADGQPADQNNLCLVYRDPQGPATSEQCQQ